MTYQKEARMGMAAVPWERAAVPWEQMLWMGMAAVPLERAAVHHLKMLDFDWLWVGIG